MTWLANAAPSPGLSGSFSTQVAVLLFAAVLGGGLFTGLGNFIRARTSSKKIRLDSDPNSPRVAIGGAETAVTLMGQALKGLQAENKRLTERVEQLEKDVEERDQQIDLMMADLRDLKTRLGTNPGGQGTVTP